MRPPIYTIILCIVLWYMHSQMSVLFLTESVPYRSYIYESNWCVNNDSISVPHKNNIKFIYFDIPSSSINKRSSKNLYNSWYKVCQFSNYIVTAKRLTQLLCAYFCKIYWTYTNKTAFIQNIISTHVEIWVVIHHCQKSFHLTKNIQICIND